MFNVLFICLKIIGLIFVVACLWVWFIGFSSIGRDIQRELDAEFKLTHPAEWWKTQTKSIHRIEKEG